MTLSYTTLPSKLVQMTCVLSPRFSSFHQIVEATASLSLGSSCADCDTDQSHDSDMHSLPQSLGEPGTTDHDIRNRFVGEVDLPECTCSKFTMFFVAHVLIWQAKNLY